MNIADADAFSHIVQYQEDNSNFIEYQRQNIAASIRASEALIAATIEAQYKRLQPNYLLLLEGSDADQRRALTNTLRIFCRVRRRSILAQAFGTWKIGLVITASDMNRPRYAKVAACHLMARWLQEVHLKKLRVWVKRWRRRVGQLIFIERSRHTLLIQTLYRHWRDRRKFVAMHKAGAFNGVLSDVYLGPKRASNYYFVPDSIRDERRLLWLAATMIQTLFRCWIQSREYYRKRRQLLLIQSVARMFPRYRKYRKLKATTIKSQAWARRTVKWKQYRRLKRATIIVQKYVRRLLCILQKWRTLHGIWAGIDERMAAAIKIQCRWRISKSRKVIAARILHAKMRTYSALVIQRNYYRYKRAFHTFFLMCALRERESEDMILDRLATSMGRVKAARVIQRRYKERFFARNISSIVKVQCWFRGRMGYNMVDILRREHWARRKLRHWGRVRVRRLHRFARKIQRCWWRAGPHRLLHHLWYRAEEKELRERRVEDERRYRAAMKIQAYVKGVWDRRWVRLHRAALIIQRNAKFFFAMKRWRRWRRERVLKGVFKYVNRVIESAVLQRVVNVVKYHSSLLRRPQAVARGMIVRAHMRRAREFAYTLGLAAVRIQRFWRTSGAMAKAVEVVMALKRAASNPFIHCTCMHDVLIMVRDQCASYYSGEDPRVGLKVSSLLHRLGCADLIDIFPRKNYVYATDLYGLTLKRLTDMYEIWRNRLQRSKGSSENTSGKVVKKSKAVPAQQLELILDVVQPPVNSKSVKDQQKLQLIRALPVAYSPVKTTDFVKKTFLRRFGKHLNARAEHLARDVLEEGWNTFNNYRIVDSPLTRAQVVRAITTATESTTVMQTLADLRQRHLNYAEERRWDLERMAAAANLMQLAIDSALVLLPVGPLRDMIEKALYRATSYRRKIAFQRSKYMHQSNRLRALSQDSDDSNSHVRSVKPGARESTAGGGGGGAPPGLTRQKSFSAAAVAAAVAAAAEDARAGGEAAASSAGGGGAGVSSPGNVVGDTSSMPDTGDEGGLGASKLEADKPITASLSLNLVYCGGEADLDLELNCSLCHLYSEVLGTLYTVTRGVQSIKNKWSNDAIKRAMAHERINDFLAAATSDYKQFVQEDKVKKVWEKFRRMDRAKQRMKGIMSAVRQRKGQILYELSFVPRYNCECYEDENGYWYWVDYNSNLKKTAAQKAAESTEAAAAKTSLVAEFAEGTDEQLEEQEQVQQQQYATSYEMPVYSFTQYLMLQRIQRVARAYLVGAFERKRLREEAERLDILRMEAELEEQRLRGRRHVHVGMTFKCRVLTYTAKGVGAGGTGGGAAVIAASALQATAGSKAAATTSDVALVVPTSPMSTMTTLTHKTSAAPAPQQLQQPLQQQHLLQPTIASSKKRSVDFKDMLPTKESILPWHLRFEVKPIFTPGTWALLRVLRPNPEYHRTNAAAAAGAGAGRQHQHQQQQKHISNEPNFQKPAPRVDLLSPGTRLRYTIEYQVVVVFRVRDGERMCDVRTVKSRHIRNVHMSHLCQMNLAVGLQVETRYRQQKVFYRSTVTRVDTFTDAVPSYTIRYEDGEIATSLRRDAIRPSGATLREFLRERELRTMHVHQQYKRQIHFAAMQRQRMVRMKSNALEEYCFANAAAIAKAEAQAAAAAAKAEAEAAAAAAAAGDGGEMSSMGTMDTLGTGEDDASAASAATDGEASDEMLAIEDAPAGAAAGAGEAGSRDDTEVIPGPKAAERSDEAGDREETAAWKRSDLALVVPNNGDGGAQAQSGALVPLSPTSTMLTPMSLYPAQQPKHGRKQTQASLVLKRIHIDLRLIYSRTVYMFGWKSYEDEGSSSGGGGVRYYVNHLTNEVTEEEPVYSAEHVHAVGKLQQCWFRHKARKEVRDRVYSLDLLAIINDVVRRGSKVAWIGYDLEGITPMQILIRAGFWELAETIEGHYKSLKMNMSSLSIEDIASKSRDEADSIGVMQPPHAKQLREFQTWWAKASVVEKHKRLSLFNYYSDPVTDTRSILQCITDSETFVLNKFMKVVKTGATRTRMAVKSALVESKYPHSFLQLDNYLRKYGDKPELARVRYAMMWLYLSPESSKMLLCGSVMLRIRRDFSFSNRYCIY